MAVDMFLKIEGIKGESADKAHKDEIDVLAWSWGISQSGSAQLGPGAGAGKVSVQDLSFTKYIDASSPDLLLSCCNGKHLDEALLTVRKAGENPVEYLKIKMNRGAGELGVHRGVGRRGSLDGERDVELRQGGGGLYRAR